MARTASVRVASEATPLVRHLKPLRCVLSGVAHVLKDVVLRSVAATLKDEVLLRKGEKDKQNEAYR